jgi:uncharacterized protein
VTHIGVIVVTLAILLASSCQNQQQESEPMLPTTTMQIGDKTFTLEIADTEELRQRGLMYRDSMPADHGMIFVFEEEDHLSFYMRNTRIPLDIIYLDRSGKVVSIHPMKPHDLTSVRSGKPAQYAIELNRGAAADVGVKVGDVLKLPLAVRSDK